MGKIKWSVKITHETNWVGHILRINCLLCDAIEGQITELKEVGKRRTQVLDYLRNRRRYWGLKEEAKDRNRWKRQFINGIYGRNKHLP